MSFGAFGSSGGGGGFGGNPFGTEGNPFGSGGAGSQDICTMCGANRSNGGLCMCNQQQQHGFGSPQQQSFGGGSGGFGSMQQQQQPNLPQTVPIILCDHIFSVPCDGTPINQVVASILKQIGQQ